MATMIPQRKVAVGGLVSAIVVVMTWASKSYGGVEVPAEIAVAVNGVLAFAFSYMIPNAEPPEFTE